VKRDIANKEDLLQVLSAFYDKAVADETIGHFFTQVIPLDIPTHLPVIAAFWEAVVFGKTGYSKNVMQVHQHIHQLSAITPQHLERWVLLFTTTIDALFEGENATLMKHRAASIATMMNIKLNHSPISIK
jgi:hemoglobin